MLGPDKDPVLEQRDQSLSWRVTCRAQRSRLIVEPACYMQGPEKDKPPPRENHRKAQLSGRPALPLSSLPLHLIQIC